MVVTMSLIKIVAFKNETNLENPTDEDIVIAVSNGVTLSEYTTPKNTDLRIPSGNLTVEDLHKQFPEAIEKITSDGSNNTYLIKKTIVIGKDAKLNIVNSKILLKSLLIKDNAPVVIINYGKTIVFNSTVTSWDPQIKIPDPNPYHPRSFLVSNDGGIMNILNSTISYMGFSQGGIHTLESDLAALNYYNTSNFVIANSTISHNLYGFYSKESSKFKIINNQVYDQIAYGLDPHSGSKDFIIDSNHIFVNGGQGIICSFRCNNITIANNIVEYNN